MKILGNRKTARLLQFLIFFGLFWFGVYLYVSTWQSDVLKNLKETGFQDRFVANGELNTDYEDPEERSPRRKKILAFRKMFNLTNPGDMGEPVDLPRNLPVSVQKMIRKGWEDYTINEFISDLIPLRRRLPDIRGDYCKDQVFENLPKASIIIIFHNEAWSMILRTLHSVMDRSPDELVEEIILVDDCSDRDHLQKPLERYLSQFPKVKLLRSPRRNGVMLSRMWGATNAKGPVLVFIDCHMEVMDGYLEPLLERIQKNRNCSAIPVIDNLNRENLAYHYNSDAKTYIRHGFAWNMDHTWIDVPEYERKKHKSPWEPYYSVTMLGAMFSIHKDFFLELGMYDPNFDVYGAEDVELSFKVWLCGGILEQVPCSHAGHMFREKFFYTFPKGRGGYRWNTDRLAEVWLDDYKKYYYRTVGDEKRNFGDISEQVELRKRLECKNFDWLIKNVYPDIEIPEKIRDKPEDVEKKN